ncbi:ABC transporter substrate-binding protein [Streptomyces otsuchiensis]|uniref:ABC transporter substrate-binding protein n=1 Tax=Streptomyces otsuchiensis TaxID=2681388 RepID=UPI001030CBD6|nr:ABC transporter substrate-binding protein [Streptomyces otsuchiensis]
MRATHRTGTTLDSLARRTGTRLAAGAVVGTFLLAGCGDMSSGGGSASGSGSAADSDHCESVTEVRVVLQWVAQAQFAGYYAAQDQGLYAEQCLKVTIQEGGVNIVPQQVLSAGNAEFAVTHVTKTMATREQGADLVNIGQVFQRGAYLQVAWADSGIETLADLKGKRVGSWGYGNELALYAAMNGAGVNPAKDTEIIQQPFDMSLLLKREVDAAQAKTYNEYAQLLESTNPETGELYQPEDFVAINIQDEGYEVLEDGIYARGDWLEDEANQDIAVQFLKATYQGWEHCRDDLEGCVDIVLKNGSALGRGHQTWMLNEVNKLIWPSPDGVGMMNADAWEKTIDISYDGGVLTERHGEEAYRTDLSQRANDELAAEGDSDLTGESFEAEDVTVTPGGN